jgi:hypothetical protein
MPGTQKKETYYRENVEEIRGKISSFCFKSNCESFSLSEHSNVTLLPITKTKQTSIKSYEIIYLLENKAGFKEKLTKKIDSILQVSEVSCS